MKIEAEPEWPVQMLWNTIFHYQSKPYGKQPNELQKEYLM